MIERAIILKIQKEQPNVQLFIKLILMINRIYYPQMIAITVFSSTLLLFLNVSIYYYVYIFLLMQTIFISICIFRKNCASVPEERSAIPLQTEQSSAG